MAYSPPFAVQELVTEDIKSGRTDSVHTPLLYNTLRTTIFQQPTPAMSRMSMSPSKAYPGHGENFRPLPRSRDQKQVTFELLLPGPQSRARLPMRIMISKHDTTDSIITTVKNFYGLYDGPGVSFQDRQANLLIGAYDNFQDGMTIYVKVTDIMPSTSVEGASLSHSTSPRKPQLGPPFEMRPPTHISRSNLSNTTRSPSPGTMNSYMNHPAMAGAQYKRRSSRSQEPGAAADAYGDALSDSDGGNGSVTSSRRSRADAHASAEISVENILEGGRRKRAKFESSELPLFVPPQVPVATSVSSVSPQRRANGDIASPLPFPNQRTFMYSQALPSPQSYGKADAAYINPAPATVYSQGPPFNNPTLRGRPTISYPPPRRSVGGILPTPEPTVGSVISDEDVALQLMRLGDASNFSHGKTSTSTIDDALSGKAEAASSDEESDEEEAIVLPGPRYPIKDAHSEGPRKKKLRLQRENSAESTADEYKDESFKGDSDEILHDHSTLDDARQHVTVVGQGKPRGSMSSVSMPLKDKSKLLKTNKSTSEVPSRKTSLGSVSLPLGPDEEDLSAKPRCQRCRKSKKGCDRERPCGRCKDAGIGAEGCISEDEGNGRRGRYGRHMGVAIKKEGPDDSLPMAPTPIATATATSGGTFLKPAVPTDKSKKRKRAV